VTNEVKKIKMENEGQSEQVENEELCRVYRLVWEST